jgi:iron complex transport system ATP-binding protein
MSKKKTILECKNIEFKYGKRKVLKDVSFSIEEGTYTSVVGPNGSGKSTLFNILSGYFSLNKGSVYLDGKNLNSLRVEERATLLSIINQSSDMRFPFTCLETVLMGAHPHRSRFQGVDDELLESAKRLMEMTDTYKFASRKITELSGGEVQRVLISRAIMQNPKILLLDEAMSELDVSSKFIIANVLKQLIDEEGLTIISIHHDLSLAYRFSDNLVVFKDGEVVTTGNPDDVCNEEFFKNVFNVKAQIFQHEGFIIQGEC